MKFYPYVLMIGLLAMCACHRQTWYRAPGGLEYCIASAHPGGVPVSGGATVKLRFTQKIGDSVYLSTTGNMPFYQALIPGLVPPYSFAGALAFNLHEGDSVVCRQSLDTLLSRKLIRIQPWMKGQDELVTSFKVLRVFPNGADSLLKADKAGEKARLDAVEYTLGDKRVQDYLRSHHIRAVKTPAGTWIDIIAPGTGGRLQGGRTAFLQFRLKNLQGRILSSNLDTGYHQPPVLRDSLFSRLLPPAADASLCLLGRGGHALIYIPAMRGFGGIPSGPNSLRYDDLELEVIVKDMK